MPNDKRNSQTKPSKPDASRSWCSGKIYFTEQGCLYIEDKTLAAAIDAKVALKGSICISYALPDDPNNQMNVQCNC